MQFGSCASIALPTLNEDHVTCVVWSKSDLSRSECIIIYYCKLSIFGGEKSSHHQGGCPVQSGTQKRAEAPKFESAAVLFGNVFPYSLVVGKKLVNTRYVTCGTWSESGLSRSECRV